AATPSDTAASAPYCFRHKEQWQYTAQSQRGRTESAGDAPSRRAGATPKRTAPQKHAPSITRGERSSRAAELDQLDVEHERGVRRNVVAEAALAVAELRRDEQQPPAADSHAGYALIPAIDHAPGADLERERAA